MFYKYCSSALPKKSISPILTLITISVDSPAAAAAAPVKFATLGRPVKRPMLMAARGESVMLASRGGMLMLLMRAF